jgi:hypothetical protein
MIANADIISRRGEAKRRLAEFASQEEARGIGSIDCAEFDLAVTDGQSVEIKRSNIAFRISRKFERKENSTR